MHRVEPRTVTVEMLREEADELVDALGVAIRTADTSNDQDIALSVLMDVLNNDR
ncbi:hypothetical protein ACQEU8_02375 [Streptomyces sp. CA-250714]|uniref:hypothetical protein n=1 Tax=Streptomyces sp. CA-250714 TaxID=3240060 RepID=UPI003D9166AA